MATPGAGQYTLDIDAILKKLLDVRKCTPGTQVNLPQEEIIAVLSKARLRPPVFTPSLEL